MTATTQILPFVTSAAGSGGNRLSPTDYAALTTLLADGFQSGAAQSVQVNTVLAQTSFMSAGLANWIVSQGISVPDDGNLTNLVTEINEAIQAAISGSLSVPNETVVSATGTYTVPAGCSAIDVEAWGAGGGGGAGYATSYNGSGAGGGGYARGRYSVTPGSTYAATIGTGGNGGGGGSSYGGNGGSTSLGSLITASGGTGGQSATSVGNGVVPGPGGSGSGGYFAVPGQVGSNAGTGFNGYGGGSFGIYPNGPYIGGPNGTNAATYAQGGGGGYIGGTGGNGGNGIIIVRHLP